MNRLIISASVACVLTGGCVPLDPAAHDPIEENTLLIFHNNTGPMCVEALEWLDEMATTHPDLEIVEKLVFLQADLAYLYELEDEYGQSQGMSSSFGYLPIIFFGEHAFSGFNGNVQADLEQVLEDAF